MLSLCHSSQSVSYQRRKKCMGDGRGGHWLLVRMEWHPSGWSVCLPLLIFPCTIKSRSSLLAPAHPDGPGKRAVKRLWCGCDGVVGKNASRKMNDYDVVLQTAAFVKTCLLRCCEVNCFTHNKFPE